MKRIYLILALLLSFCGTVHALDAFTISDIRVEGLQRITEGTVFNYLPVEIGDVLTPGMSKTAIRELYRRHTPRLLGFVHRLLDRFF